MTQSELTSLIKDRVSREFPNIRVRIGPLFNEALSLGVEVFGVENPDLEKVEAAILDIDWNIAAPHGFALTPLVVSRAETLRYYPAMMPPTPEWRPSPDGVVCELEPTIPTNVGSETGVIEPQMAWLGGDGGLVACNEDLALAA